MRKVTEGQFAAGAELLLIEVNAAFADINWHDVFAPYAARKFEKLAAKIAKAVAAGERVEKA